MRSFWLLTGATAVSTAGNTFLYLAVPWALVNSTGSSLLAVLSLAAQTAPYLAAPFLGAFIDRYYHRFLFAACELIQGACVALIPLLLAIHNIGMVFVALCVMGLAKVVSDVAGDYGLIPALVPRERLDQASSWFNSVQLTARFAGPAVAGLTISAVGPGWALEIDAATFLFTALTVFFLPKVGKRRKDGTSLTALLREGVAYFRSRPDLKRLTMAVALYNLGAGALEVTLLTVGADQWTWSATALGVAVACGAVAAALGSWLSPTVLAGDARRHHRISMWLGVAALGSLGLLFSAPLAVVLGFCVLCFGEGGVNATTMAYRQHEIPSELSGRVNAVIRMFMTGAVPVSALLLGLTANLSGSLQVFFPVTVTALLAASLWTVRGKRSEAVPPSRLMAVSEKRSV
jgi:MFS family permease